jgi:hypothetical protein
MVTLWVDAKVLEMRTDARRGGVSESGLVVSQAARGRSLESGVATESSLLGAGRAACCRSEAVAEKRSAVQVFRCRARMKPPAAGVH